MPHNTPYHYAFNNPISFHDPTGLIPEKLDKGGVNKTQVAPIDYEASNEWISYIRGQVDNTAARRIQLMQMAVMVMSFWADDDLGTPEDALYVAGWYLFVKGGMDVMVAWNLMGEEQTRKGTVSYFGIDRETSDKIFNELFDVQIAGDKELEDFKKDFFKVMGTNEGGKGIMQVLSYYSKQGVKIGLNIVPQATIRATFPEHAKPTTILLGMASTNDKNPTLYINSEYNKDKFYTGTDGEIMEYKGEGEGIDLWIFKLPTYETANYSLLYSITHELGHFVHYVNNFEKYLDIDRDDKEEAADIFFNNVIRNYKIKHIFPVSQPGYR